MSTKFTYTWVNDEWDFFIDYTNSNTSKRNCQMLPERDLAKQTGLEPAHRLHDYWLISNQLPYQLGLLLRVEKG